MSVNSSVRILDLTHAIRPQDLRHADYFLCTAVPYFPPGTIHVCVVDPGVGSSRRALLARAGGQWMIGPDNGTLGGALQQLGSPVVVRELTAPQFWRTPVSDTFHGRDVFAAVAGHLSRGIDPAEFGPTIDSWIELPRVVPSRKEGTWEGEVQFIDDFGNLVTNIPAEGLDRPPLRVGVGGVHPHPVRWVRTYSEGEPGELVALISSDGYFEVAVVNGSAAGMLAATAGMRVRLEKG